MRTMNKFLAASLALSLLPVTIFAYMGQFSRLMLDDYHYLDIGRDLGPWGAMIYMRNTWNGGYTDQFMHGIFARFGTTAPRILPFLLATLWLLALAWLIKCALSRLDISAPRNAVALGAAALITAGMIDAFHTHQSFYWYTAGVAYSLPLAAFVLYFVLALKSARIVEHKPRFRMALLIGFVYCFMVAGTSAMHLVFQATFLAILLATAAIHARRTGLKAHFAVIAAGFAGTVASFFVQITAPGVALRITTISPLESVSKRALPDFAQSLAEALVWLGGYEKTFAGFIMLFGFGLFAALLLHRSPSGLPLRGPAELAAAPLWCGMIAQLVFLTILWTHTSDQTAVMGRFSYAFSTVIVLNLGFLLLFLFLLWRRRQVSARLFASRSALLILSAVVLLMALVLFATVYFRSIHYRASRYLITTSMLLIGMLAWQLAHSLGDEQSRQYGQATLLMALMTFASYIVLLGVPLYTLGKINARVTAPSVLLHVLMGLVWGAYTGYLIRRASPETPMHEIWRRRIGLSGLAVAYLIGAGIVLGQARYLPNLRTFAQEWDERERMIISQRDSGQLDVVVAPLSYDLTWHLMYERMSKPSESGSAAKYYGVESIRVDTDHP